ncbi:MAG: hypothetical protein M3437_10775 [Chloroflexota bacterium]|nr:hypothetical protein [Chloroflexota bacterium]MDQ5867444.1 hypothetical protein [Chloroflexota bacterium]
MAKAVTLDEIVQLTRQLSLLDKVRLIEQLAPQIEQELKVVQPAERTPLRGLWKGVDISEEEIAEARREMWGSFPREDI